MTNDISARVDRDSNTKELVLPGRELEATGPHPPPFVKERPDGHFQNFSKESERLTERHKRMPSFIWKSRPWDVCKNLNRESKGASMPATNAAARKETNPYSRCRSSPSLHTMLRRRNLTSA